LKNVAWASQLRVFLTESWFQNKKSRVWKNKSGADVDDDSSFRFLRWMSAGVLGAITNAQEKFSAEVAPLPNAIDALDPKRKGIQKKLYLQLNQTQKLDPLRIIKKMSRWDLGKLGNNSWLLVKRMKEVLDILQEHTPPRVRNATFSVWWNRACTGRRYQKGGQCLLCNKAKDEI
jgi:hypothetical protein